MTSSEHPDQQEAALRNRRIIMTAVVWVLMIGTGKLSVPNGLKIDGKTPKLIALKFQD